MTHSPNSDDCTRYLCGAGCGELEQVVMNGVAWRCIKCHRIYRGWGVVVVAGDGTLAIRQKTPRPTVNL